MWTARLRIMLYYIKSCSTKEDEGSNLWKWNVCLRTKNGRLLRIKNLKVSDLYYEMLVDIGKKYRPSKNPEKMMESLIQERCNS